ncbi:MAG: energy-coupling factor ABC transporter ATP-binding protein, partial [Candidatus Omnitrophica bacterium]|nr:energy-coupling factor ABC transporter ATP-binding protein [Candidatus Omnitrophota bacterium]
HLSMGEKKRVALATVLCMGVKILALDEPTSSLDPRGKKELTELLRGFTQTQVIATHDLKLARELCNRIVLLKNGEKIADDTVENILRQKNLLLLTGLE